MRILILSKEAVYQSTSHHHTAIMYFQQDNSLPVLCSFRMINMPRALHHAGNPFLPTMWEEDVK